MSFTPALGYIYELSLVMILPSTKSQNASEVAFHQSIFDVFVVSECVAA